MKASTFWLATVAISCHAQAQYFPPLPQDVTVSQTQLGQVSYKQTSICETTPGVKAYSGYISLPASSLANINGFPGYDINTFFWFFESRKDPENAPFAIYIQGGPGFNTMSSVLNEAGPCFVNEDSNSTTLNPLSWNNEVNMLYIDQPNQVGFSYDTLVNGTVNQLSSPLVVQPLDSSSPIPQPNNTFDLGTFPSQNVTHTANSTGNAAEVFWNVLQTFVEGFGHQYLPQDNKISIWSESYGGRYLPSFARFIADQNNRIADGSLAGFQQINFDTFGLINAWIDPRIQVQAYPQMAFNNTYGVQAYPQEVFELAQGNLTMKDGCLDQVDACQALVDKADPTDVAANVDLDTQCAQAYTFCLTTVQAPYNILSGRSQDDIASDNVTSFPSPRYNGFLNQHWVQQDLGAAVNFTDNSATILEAFVQTGDIVRNGSLQDLAFFLDSGIKVALLYGDRDYEVNWIGGEAASLAIPTKLQPSFASAGYTPFMTNNTTQGGLTRQFGPLSFTRVFQSGHQVAAYQPELAYEIFMRAMFDKDIATGQISLGGNGTVYQTQGSANTFDVKEQAPPMEKGFCYVLSTLLTCTTEEIGWLVDGTAIVRDFVVVGRENGTVVGGAGGNGSAPTGTGSGSESGNGNGTVSPSGPVASAMFTGGASKFSASAMSTLVVALTLLAMSILV